MKVDSTDFETQYSMLSVGINNYVVNTFQALLNQLEKVTETNKKLDEQLKILIEENNKLKSGEEPHPLNDK